MKYVSYFLKQTIFPLIYAVIMLMINLSIMIIGDHLMWLKYILFALSFALYAFIIGAVSFKEGEESVKIRHMNDVERLNIIRTGEDRPLNLVKEYKPWKGFVSGLTVCLPLIIFMLIQTIYIAAGSDATWAGAIGSYIYIIVFAFFRAGKTQTVAPTYYYWSLVAIPVFVLMLGVPYMLGAKRQMLLYQQVEDKHKAIYGEKK